MTRSARRPSGMPWRRAGGFTLVELMVAVLTIAILAAVALPAYSSYITRGRLTEAFNQLTTLGVALEQFSQDNRTYVGACVAGTSAPLPAATTYFTYSCPTLGAAAYTLQATGNTGTAVAGFTFTLTQTGARATTAAPSGWPTSTTCWVNSRSGSCQ